MANNDDIKIAGGGSVVVLPLMLVRKAIVEKLVSQEDIARIDALGEDSEFVLTRVCLELLGNKTIKPFAYFATRDNNLLGHEVLGCACTSKRNHPEFQKIVNEAKKAFSSRFLIVLVNTPEIGFLPNEPFS